jgi:anti-anti-sigma factor
MDLSQHILPDLVVIQPRECITDENEAALKQAIDRHLRAGRVRVVLDLENVPYIDSCGQGTIAQAYLNLVRAGGWLRLQNVRGRTHQLLSVTRLLGVIGVYGRECHAASA